MVQHPSLWWLRGSILRENLSCTWGLGKGAERLELEIAYRYCLRDQLWRPCGHVSARSGTIYLTTSHDQHNINNATSHPFTTTLTQCNNGVDDIWYYTIQHDLPLCQPGKPLQTLSPIPSPNHESRCHDSVEVQSVLLMLLPFLFAFLSTFCFLL